VHDTLAVGYVQGIGDFNSNFDQPLHLQRPPRDQMLQGPAFHVLHHDERMSVLLVDFVDGTNVGMIQRGRRFGLKLKAA